MRAQVTVGMQYGKWVVEAPADLRGNERYYACVCQCGARSMVRKSVLVAAKSGCVKCAPRGHTTTHGMTRAFEFSVWTAMKKRCQYVGHPHYALYGGRGISVCAAWQQFETFYRDMGACPHGRLGSIDRIDPDGNYEPGNCRWVLKAAQAKHRRNVPLIDGKTLPEVASELGIKYSTLRTRIKAGWAKELWGKTPQELGTRR